MRDWLQHVGQFIVAVIRVWGVLVSGGVLVGVVAVSEHFAGQSISGWPLWTAIILSIVAAFFSAWRRERQKWERLGGLSLLSVTPDEMISVYSDRTTAQGRKLAKIYQGKWIKVSGPVRDIEIVSYNIWFDAVHVSLERGSSKAVIHMRFSRRWSGRFSAIQRGDVITALGKILYVAENHITLKSCELLSIGMLEHQTTQD